MAKKRVHEIAKAQGLTSKELLDRLRAAGLDVKAAASSIDEAAALKAIGGNGAAPAAAPVPEAKARAAKTKPAQANKASRPAATPDSAPAPTPTPSAAAAAPATPD